MLTLIFPYLILEASLDFWLTEGRFTDEFEKKFSEYLKIKHTNLLYGPMKGREVPCFEFKKHTIWGATAMILNEFKFFLAFNSVN